MLRLRLDYTAQLEEWHAESVKRAFRNRSAEEKAFETWKNAPRQKRKTIAPGKARCSCPGCDLEYPT